MDIIYFPDESLMLQMMKNECEQKNNLLIGCLYFFIFKINVIFI